jgi:O-antigen/teichoic acid export membrane protein
MLLPINQIISMISEVMFSVMSRMQTDPTRLRTSYVRVLRVIALTSFPLMIGLWVSAEAFVHVVFGPQWDAAIPIIRILAPVGMIQAILNPTGWIYLSLGRTRTRMWVGLVTSAGLVLAIVAGAVITGSVLGMALWYAAGNLVIMVPELVIPGRMIGMQLLDVLLAILAPLLIAVAMGATVWIVDGWWLVGESYAQRLAVDVGLGALIYLGLVVLFRLEAARDLLGIIGRRAPMGSAPA